MSFLLNTYVQVDKLPEKNRKCSNLQAELHDKSYIWINMSTTSIITDVVCFKRNEKRPPSARKLSWP